MDWSTLVHDTAVATAAGILSAVLIGAWHHLFSRSDLLRNVRVDSWSRETGIAGVYIAPSRAGNYEFRCWTDAGDAEVANSSTRYTELHGQVYDLQIRTPTEARLLSIGVNGGFWRPRLHKQTEVQVQLR